jgi:hypothetical protein
MAIASDDDARERATGGLDYDNPIRERAASLGSSIAENGPEVLFDEIEKLLPETWREHIQAFPIAALALGFGVGIFLGMKKGDEVMTAGSSMLTAAAMSNLTGILDRATGNS